MSATKPVVLLAEELSPATVEALGPDFEIRQTDGADRSQLLSAIADVDAILVRSATQVDAEAIAAAKNLKVIARAGVGLDNVDIKSATQAGVMVVNAPTSNIVSAAELTVGHILSLARHIPQASSALKNGEWKRSKYTGIELFEKKIGIIGLGGGLDVDVVQADAGPRDDLQVLRSGNGLGVHLGGGADQDGVNVLDGREQLGTIGAVGLADFKVRAKGLDGGGRKLFGKQYYGF